MDDLPNPIVQEMGSPVPTFFSVVLSFLAGAFIVVAAAFVFLMLDGGDRRKERETLSEKTQQHLDFMAAMSGRNDQRSSQ